MHFGLGGTITRIMTAGFREMKIACVSREFYYRQ